MFLFGDEDDFSFNSSSHSSDGCGTTESFLSNTFRDGGLPTTPTSPPTPVKVIKIETTLSDQSPLVASTPFQSFVADSECMASDEERENEVESASLPPPPCERVEAVVTCGGGIDVADGAEKEKATLCEVLTTTMTTVQERPIDFSTTTTSASVTTIPVSSDDTPCTCRRASLGKRKREGSEEEKIDCSCSCYVDQARDNGELSVCVGEDGDNEEEEKDCISSSPSKKVCNRPAALTLNGTKRLNGLNSVYTFLGLDPIAPPTSSSSASLPHSAQSPPCSPDEIDEDSSTPSPIDFTKVDPTLYDYDTRAPLLLPPTQDTPPSPPPSSATADSNNHTSGGSDNGGGGSAPTTTSPDSSSTSPLSSSLPPCSSDVALHSADDASCSSAESVTSPTLAITATSTTFSLPTSSEYPLISSSNHDCPVSKSCSDSAVESDLIGDPSTDDKHSSTSSSCSLEGLVSAQNGQLVHNESERTDKKTSINNGLKGGVPSPPEEADNVFLEDFDHIVSLLMT